MSQCNFCKDVGFRDISSEDTSRSEKAKEDNQKRKKIKRDLDAVDMMQDGKYVSKNETIPIHD